MLFFFFFLLNIIFKLHVVANCCNSYLSLLYEYAIILFVCSLSIDICNVSAFMILKKFSLIEIFNDIICFLIFNSLFLNRYLMTLYYFSLIRFCQWKLYQCLHFLDMKGISILVISSKEPYFLLSLGLCICYSLYFGCLLPPSSL